MQINYTHIAKIDKLPSESMKSFTGRGIEVYRSTNYAKTTEYFGNNEQDPCYYELIVFEYEYNQPEYFLRFPYFEKFIELTSGSKSARGTMENISIGNPINDVINPYHYEGKLEPSELTIFRNETNAMIRLGKYSDFDFLQRVAHIPIRSVQYRTDRPYGQEIIEEALSREYVKIPDFRRITYAYETTNNHYLIVDQSAFRFTYEGMRCWYGSLGAGMKLVDIKMFKRYRDGGSTVFEFDYDGNHYNFSQPTTLGNTDKVPMLNGIEIVEMSATKKSFFVENLNIMLQPK